MPLDEYCRLVLKVVGQYNSGIITGYELQAQMLELLAEATGNQNLECEARAKPMALVVSGLGKLLGMRQSPIPSLILQCLVERLQG